MSKRFLQLLFSYLALSCISYVWMPAIAAAQDQTTHSESKAKVAELVQLASEVGNPERGLDVYLEAKSACFSCHKIGKAGGRIGPDLTSIGEKRTFEQIAESLLLPNARIEPAYQAYKFLLDDSTIRTGYVNASKSTQQQICIVDPANAEETLIQIDQIEEQAKSPSLMPEGLVTGLSLKAQADLVAFLASLKTYAEHDLSALESRIAKANTHAPTTFPYVAKPMDETLYPYWKANVNRNRIFDFYRKQAMHFRLNNQDATWLEEYPGLDGREFGHWGNQTEETWRGNEWNLAKPNRVQCNVLRVQNRQIARAVCVQVSDNIHVAFNPDTLAYEAAWEGGFIRFSDVRHGYMGGVEPAGELMELPDSFGKAMDVLVAKVGPTKYLGYWLADDRVVFKYEIAGKPYFDEMAMVAGKLERTIVPADEATQKQITASLTKRWPEVLQTEVRLGSQDGLAIDTIEIPQENPWSVQIACGDLGFKRDGSIVLCSMEGDVFEVQLKENTANWRRIAAGLHHALGLWVHEDTVYVLGRNQTTRLVDANSDGETDYYECFSNAFVTSPSGHDFICGLQRDDEGNFYVASGNQGLVKISPDGASAEVLATGFRNPDGLGLLPDGFATVPCSEGDWTPASMICQVPVRSNDDRNTIGENSKPLDTPFYGYRGPQKGQHVELPLLYLPRGVDNSSGGQVFVDDARLGPLNHQLIHTSFGSGTAMMVLRDKVGNQWQGAAVPLPGQFESGIHRARVNPLDGCLYVCGMQGWGTYTTEPGCLQRMRLIDQKLQLPTSFHLHENGVWLGFAEPIDAEVATKVGSHFAQAWNYRYSPGYGSKEYSVRHFNTVGHDRWKIKSAHVGADGKSLFLEIPEIQRCSQLHLQVIPNPERVMDLYVTAHKLDAAEKNLPGLLPLQDKVFSVHPMVRDLEMLERKVLNPWQKKIPKARVIQLATRDNLQFDSKILRGKAGEAIELRLRNPDVVPHNWVLIKPDSLEEVGQLSNRLVNDPDAFVHQYVPKSDHVICYTDIVEPGSDFSIFFKLPSEPGRYPYLCTFPGHWMVMHGELIVEAN